MELVTKVLVVLFGYVTLFYGVRGFHNDPKCGQNFQRSSKIVGGEEVKEAEFPWYVSIKETGQHECGGFIINQRAVLTAAHCFKDFSERAANSPKTISVTLAVHYLQRRRLERSLLSEDFFPKNEWEQTVKVKRIIRHPYYDAFSDSGKFDIAILLLEDKVQWNYGTTPVCLPDSVGENQTVTNTNNNLNTAKNYPNEKDHFNFSSSFTELDFQSGETAIVAGWASNTDVDILHKVRLRLYSNEECMRILKEKNVILKSDLDSSVICAGSNEVGFDSCSGDSGSALLIKRDNKWVAIGIVSSGFGKCGSGRPGLYTRISTYLEWIDLHNNIDKIDSPDFFQKLSSFVPS